jgi:hypothetical protein
MDIVSLVFFIAGGIIMLIGAIMFLIVAFKASIWWGLGCIFLAPIVNLIFLFMHWKDARKPFFISLVGAAIYFAGLIFFGPGPAGA